jgi:long-chain acyl-CoA synthetase
MSEEEVRAMDTTSTEQITTGGMVRRWAAEAPEHVALRWEGGELTYRDLDERSSRVAQALLAAGVGPGDRVAYLDKNGPEQVELLFGAAKVNAVPTPVNFRLAPPEIAFIVTDAQAKVFAVGEELLPLVEKVADELSGTMLVVIGESDAHPTFAAWRDGHPADDPMVPSAPDDVAYQLYSSGTTGRPKGVQLMQSNLAAGLPLYPSLMGLGTDSTSLVAMPLFHIGGGGWLLAGVAVGATNVLVREIVPAALVELIERERITHAFLVPAVLQFMLAVPGIEERDFSALRTFLYGASPISEQVLATSVRTFGCEFVQAYGLTETTGTVVILPAADHDPSGPNRHRLRAVGLAVPGSEVRVVDTVTGEDVAQGEVGEIWIRSPMVMKGYWNLPEATEDAIRPGGWFRSGDAGYLDEDGYLYMYDRVKDMIVSGGENVYPAEVENVLMSHPGVADVAVIGIPSERWGETPRAMVVRAPGSEVTEQQLIAHAKEHLATFKCPTSVEWVEALPRNPSGKVLKKDLRAPFWAGRDRLVG